MNVRALKAMDILMLGEERKDATKMCQHEASLLPNGYAP